MRSLQGSAVPIRCFASMRSLQSYIYPKKLHPRQKIPTKTAGIKFCQPTGAEFFCFTLYELLRQSKFNSCFYELNFKRFTFSFRIATDKIDRQCSFLSSNKLDDCHLGSVTPTGTCLNDTAVTAVNILIIGGYLLKELLDNLTLCDICHYFTL